MTGTRKRLIWLGAGLLLGGVAVFGVAGWFLSRPVPRRIGVAPADLDAQSVEISVPGDRIIHGWFSPGRPGAGAVLLLHPLRGNRTTMLSRARFLHADGRAVLLVDLQGHGESAGTAITFGARESEDAARPSHTCALANLTSALPR